VTATTGAERAEPHAGGPQQVAIGTRQRPLLAPGEHEVEGLHLRGEVLVPGARPVRGRGDRAAERLRGDVAEVRHGEAEPVQRAAQRRERDAGLHADEAGGPVGVQDTVEPVQREERVVRQDRTGERVPAPGHAHPSRRGDGGGDLGAVARPQVVRRGAVVAPGPVRPHPRRGYRRRRPAASVPRSRAPGGGRGPAR
jgi:hypothetical protein